ncbi:MAG: permease-like cell division protein FtsX [Bacillota bacterium]|nr:permease-like cell division protein FtsX [Bacillota bacterium]
MFVSGLGYVISETFKGLYRNRWMCITSTGVVVVTLLMLGLFMLVSLNIGHITETVKEQVEIVVYIEDQADQEAVNELYKRLSEHSQVEEVTYVSSEEHMRRLQRQLGGMLEGYDSALDNPLLASYEIKTVVPESVVELAKEFETYPAVSTVFYGQGYVENLFAVTGVLQYVGLALMLGLAVTAIFLISHTIKLTVMMRRKEITIMKYVGASNWFIRWPFLMEGLLMGLVGAVVPLVIIYYLYQYSIEWVAGNNLYFLSLLPAEPVIRELAKYLVPLGTGLGVIGSTFSIGRFLRV